MSGSCPRALSVAAQLILCSITSSLRGIGEADFSRLKSPNLKHSRLNEILLNHSHKLRGLNRTVVDNGAVKVVKISGVDD